MKFITISCYRLEKSGYKVRHTYPPMRFNVEGLGENLTADQLHALADEYGAEFLAPAFFRIDYCS